MMINPDKEKNSYQLKKTIPSSFKYGSFALRRRSPNISLLFQPQVNIYSPVRETLADI